MSGRITLQRAGGGLTLVALIYNRLFLCLAWLLLLFLLYVIVKTIREEINLKKEEKHPDMRAK